MKQTTPKYPTLKYPTNKHTPVILHFATHHPSKLNYSTFKDLTHYLYKKTPPRDLRRIAILNRWVNAQIKPQKIPPYKFLNVLKNLFILHQQKIIDFLIIYFIYSKLKITYHYYSKPTITLAGASAAPRFLSGITKI